MAIGTRQSYRRLMELPAWLLLDDQKQTVASVRAEDEHEARRLFCEAGLEGRWLRRVPRVLNRHKHNTFGAVYVGRGTKWGNLFSHQRGTVARYQVATREEAVTSHIHWIIEGDGCYLLKQLGELRGHDLACWCAPKPCHADILLALANR